LAHQRPAAQAPSIGYAAPFKPVADLAALRALNGGASLTKRRQQKGRHEMKVIKASTRPTKVAPPENFTGTVLQDEVVTGTSPSRLRATSVSFSPGARTAWHMHPVGQTLYVLYGTGRIQKEGEAPVVLSPGDTVIIPPDVKHWHGAAPDRLFIHLAISENATDGSGTQWLEKVADADYAAAAVQPD
jgi:quercetin dioxygenase-like cupin family protein